MKLKRLWIQIGSAIVLNSYFLAPWLKGFPCPALNCYACPLAITACPIGSLQFFWGQLHIIPFYVLGVTILAALALGRGWCGWVCPFGLVQDLLARIRGNRIIRHIPAWAGAIKYVMLFGVAGFGAWYLGEPVFCKLCPAGSLEAGIPQVLLDERLQQQIGPFYFAKLGLLAVVLLASVYVSRFFCQVICPLGALFSLFNKLALFQIKLDDSACKSCGVCAKRFCPVGLKAETEANNTACIKCGECQKCPTEAVTTGIDF